MGKSKSINLSKSKIILIFSAIFLFFLFLFFTLKKTEYPKEIKVNINNQNYYLEIASTPKQQAIGLSNRNSICTNCGMLFIFSHQGDQSFWMKNTLIPLDIIWLDKKFKIVKIVTALNTNSQKSYTAKAKYVIEVNANEAFKHNLKIGDTIQLPMFND